jgi:hypothetical protein
MKKMLAIALLAVAPMTFTVAEDIDTDIQNRVLGATVKILMSTEMDHNRISSGGSGTIIFNGSHTGELGVVRRVVIATANHVLIPTLFSEMLGDEIITRDVSLYSISRYLRDDTGEIRAEERFLPQTSLLVSSYKIIRYEAVDAAFIIVDLKPGCMWLSDVKAVEMAGTPRASRLVIGSDLLVAGCPIMVNPIIFRNRLVQRNLRTLSFRNPGTFIGHLVSRVFTGGNSGGGVYTSDGKYIGIVTLRIGEDFGAFTGIEHILPLAILDRDVMLLMNP